MYEVTQKSAYRIIFIQASKSVFIGETTKRKRELQTTQTMIRGHKQKARTTAIDFQY